MVEMGTGVCGSCVGNGYSYWESVQVVAMAQGFGVGSQAAPFSANWILDSKRCPVYPKAI